MDDFQVTDKLLDRFWSKVAVSRNDDVCWEWIASTAGGGYGWFYMSEGNAMPAHRAAFFFAYGYWPKICMHKCDNKKCVNPNHLESGTSSQNNKDAYARGLRTSVNKGLPAKVRGEDLPQSKLTEQDIRDIRNSQDSTHSLMAYYGISQSLVSLIKNRKRWKHVE